MEQPEGEFARCLLARRRQQLLTDRRETNDDDYDDDDDDPTREAREAFWKTVDVSLSMAGAGADGGLRRRASAGAAAAMVSDQTVGMQSQSAGNDESSSTQNAGDGISPRRQSEGQRIGAVDERDENEFQFQGFTKFHRLCALPRNGPTDPRWDDVRAHLDRLSSDLSRNGEELTSTQGEGLDYTPLHLACFLSPPRDVVREMVRLCPESASAVARHGDTPLSLACGGFVPAGADVIEELVGAWPEARDATNSRGENPLIIHVRAMHGYELDPCPHRVRSLATVEAVNARDARGRSALYYFGRAAASAFSTMASLLRFFSERVGSSDVDNYKKCLDIVINLGPARDSKTKYLRDLIELPQSIRDVAFMHKCTRMAIMDIVGRGQYIACLMMEFYVQILIALAFTLGCRDNFRNRWYTVVTLAGSVFWLLRTLLLLTGSSQNWTEINFFLLLTLTQAIVLFVSSVHLRNNGIDLAGEGESGPWRNILILNTALIWTTLMGILCHVAKGFSVFVHATVQIFKKLLNLLLVFVIISACFSTIFFFTMVDSAYCAVDAETGDPHGDYCTLHDAVNKVLTLFFGTLEADDFDVPAPTKVALVLFNVIVIILLLNIIIAAMSSIYEDASGSAERIFWDHRFELIRDVDSTWRGVQLIGGCFVNRDKKPRDADKQDEFMDHAWFEKVIHFQKTTTIPKPIANLLAFVVMGLWFLAGMLTCGFALPRCTRKKIFTPSITDYLAEDHIEAKVEVDKMKQDMRALEEKNAKLIKENKALREMLDTARKKSP